MNKSKIWLWLTVTMLVALVAQACNVQPTTIPIDDIVRQTVEANASAQPQPVNIDEAVRQTVEAAGPTADVGAAVQQTLDASSFTRPHPILGDVKVRQAIAYCTNRAELIQSVYPWLPAEDQEKLMMDTNIPRISWAYYGGAEVQKYPFDVAKGEALLEEAGWVMDENSGYRSKDGNLLSLKFTTTTAEFRKTWAAVFEENMAACGIQIVRLHAPGSWWFGDTTGLQRRDYELGAYAWVGETDPKGQTLYACNQIPFPRNNWAGQNTMGWCNETASNAINAANNSLVREERIAQYKIFQIEFAKDMVSLPVFQRAEGSAASPELQNFKPTPTDYYNWNSWEWELPGKDTLVIALSQEPDTMYSLVASMATQRNVAWMVYEAGLNGVSQVDYDFQPVLVTKLSTVESGLAENKDVEVTEGTEILDASGTPADVDGNLYTLKSGVKIRTADGQEVEYTGGTVTMKQLVVKYQWQPTLKWSDGEAVVKADFELAYKNDCDPKSGAVDLSLCQSIASVDFTSDTEYVVTYKPGYQGSLYFLPPFTFYPSHQVLSDGRKLADVPTEEWATLPEVAETPLGVGPYMIKSWEKGVKMVLEANPYYWRGAEYPKVKNIVVTIVEDTNQAVAQLLTGDVDIVGAETLGAGAEVQMVLDAQKEGKVQVLIEPSATWEHIDMQLFVP